MNDESATLPVVGPWAEDKLSRLGKYLDAYTTILRKQPWFKGYVYIDALAGAGRSTLRDDLGTRLLLDGSPGVALKLKFPFTRYVFIEKASERATELERLKQEYGDSRQIKIYQGDCCSYLSKLVSQPARVLNGWKGIVFLDPFGMQVPWSVLEGLGRTRKFEVIVNFPLGMAIHRVLPRKVALLRRKQLDQYFGDPGWFDVVYAKYETLFGSDLKKVEGSGDRLLEWYLKRLEGIFGLVSQPYLVRNSRGGYLYYLIWAGNNNTGLRIANHVLRSGAPIASRLPPGSVNGDSEQASFALA